MATEMQVSAVIAGASAFLKYKEEHPRESDEDALKYVVVHSKEIADGVDLD